MWVTASKWTVEHRCSYFPLSCVFAPAASIKSWSGAILLKHFQLQWTHLHLNWHHERQQIGYCLYASILKAPDFNFMLSLKAHLGLGAHNMAQFQCPLVIPKNWNPKDFNDFTCAIIVNLIVNAQLTLTTPSNFTTILSYPINDTSNKHWNLSNLLSIPYDVNCLSAGNCEGFKHEEWDSTFFELVTWWRISVDSTMWDWCFILFVP